AVVALVPESRSAKRPSIDFVGVLLSSGGLVALMYGVVQAGANGWGSASAIVPAAAGLLAPMAFGVFGLFGALFTLPQYFQAIVGLDPQGSGFRLLPVIGGLLGGAVTADRVAARLGAKITVAAGFALVAVGLVVGTSLSATSGDGFIAAWTFVAGLGAGFVFATAASAAVVELSADRSGVGAALLQAVVKLGPAFGASFLGSVLNSTYQAQVAVSGLPASAAAAVKASVFGGLAVAQQTGSAELLASVKTAFVAGMDDAVRITAGVALVAIVLALLFLPARARAAR